MGKLILISGANGSGKSRWAEELIAKTTGPRYYIATMEPRTEENHKRIQKHIDQRAGLGFTTLELPTGVRDAAVTGDSVVLLEDVSNLLSNTIFARGGSMAQVREDITALQSRCKLLAAVTIGGLSSDGYSGETASYIDDLNALNVILGRQAQAVVHIQDHCPTWEKGGIHDIL